MKKRWMNYRALDSFFRHFKIAWRHLTVKKLANVAFVLPQYFLRRPKVFGRPFLLKVESSSFCNLKCDGCRSGKSNLKLDDGRMTIGLYKSILDDIGDYILEAALYVWGEPLSNKDICGMVELSNQRNIGTVISTNMHFMTESMARGLINAGLDKLIIAIDGATSESYEKVRAGGDFNLVMRNLETFVRCKREMNSALPEIEWQYIRTDFNKGEMEEAQKTAARLGINYFNTIPDWSSRENSAATQKNRMKAYKAKRKICRWLWFAIAVQWNGDIYPCCHVANNPARKFRNLKEIKISEIWNDSIYVNSRRKYALRNKLNKGEGTCFRCPV